MVVTLASRDSGGYVPVVMTRGVTEGARKFCTWFEMYGSVDGMFASGSDLCSWINNYSRICKIRQSLTLPITSGLWKSTLCSGIAGRMSAYVIFKSPQAISQIALPLPDAFCSP